MTTERDIMEATLREMEVIRDALGLLKRVRAGHPVALEAEKLHKEMLTRINSIPLTIKINN